MKKVINVARPLDLFHVRKRLRRLETHFEDCSRKSDNVSYIHCNDLNSIRSLLIREGDLEISSFLESDTMPVKASDGSPPYPSRPDLTLHLCQQILDVIPAEDDTFPLDENSKSTSDRNKIFIVHGHDEVNRLRLEKILSQQLEMQPVVLSDVPSKGLTLIEKFEEVAHECNFAIVLMTPDDQVAKEDISFSQSRPNVIFELGWFYGRLGRARVCILCKKGTSIHSDLSGILRIEFEHSVEECFKELEMEIKKATD